MPRLIDQVRSPNSKCAAQPHQIGISNEPTVSLNELKRKPLAFKIPAVNVFAHRPTKCKILGGFTQLIILNARTMFCRGSLGRELWG